MGYNTDILDDESISAYGKLTYFALSKYANKQGECWPSMDELATKANISSRSVQRAVNELVKTPWLIRKNRKSQLGISASNFYILPNLHNRTNSPNVQTNSPNDTDYGTQRMDCEVSTVRTDSPTNLSNITYPINNDEKEILEYLPTISQYPFDVKKDLEQVREWLKNYPVKDILDELEKFNAWWRDKQSSFKSKKNFRSSITNWLKRSQKQTQAAKPKRKFLFDD